MSRENRFCPDCGNLTEHVVIRLDETNVRRICVRCNSVHDVSQRSSGASRTWTQPLAGEGIPRIEP
jgi:ribosomal protein S27AE